MRSLYTKNKCYIVLLGLIFNLTILSGQSLYINEFMAGNTMIPDEFGEFDDWIELYNGGPTPIDINGYFLSDDISNPLFFQIDTSVIIDPGGFILLWADKDPEQGKLHLDFKLSATGEQISVMSSFGEFTDSLTYPMQIDDISSGRAPDGSSNFFLFTDPTPGVSNSTSGSIGTAENPTHNFNGGFYENNISLELSTTTPGGIVYYTLDGTDPEETSTPYVNPISINSSTVVRSKVFASDYLPSDIISHEYFINEDYTLPVISIVTDPDNMFGPDGIYSNPAESGAAWERFCQVQYFKNDTLGFSIDCGIRIQGSSSVINPKKSFRLYFDEDYGENRLEYPIFENNEVADFKNLVLRASADDDISMANGTLLRDPLGNRAYQNSDGLISDGNWAILKINGEYWGIYEVRESINDKFIESHTGWNNFDLIRFEENGPDLKAGTWDDWNFLRNFLETTDFSIESNYLQATELIDIDNLVNILAVIQTSSFSDWSVGVYTYKNKTVGKKWKYTLWDMEESHISQSWNAQADYGMNTPTTWANFINAALTPNETFRNKLVNRTADLLNTSYLPSEASTFLNGIKLEIEAEIPGEYNRWNSGMNINDWNNNVDNIHTFLQQRPDILRTDIVDHYSFNDINTINLDIVGSGVLELNTIDISSFPWSGIYFENIPVPIKAVAGPGYVFSGWSDPTLPNDPSIEIAWADTYDLTAFFTPGSTQIADVIINEINYNSAIGNDAGDWVELYNASGAPVDLSLWYFKDGGSDYFSIPDGMMIPTDGYLVLVEDSLLFQTAYPSITNFIGNFDGFKLSNNGEFISISNADASYQDTVHYNDISPWPTEPDGTGPTLQLRSPDLDNALASSWSTFDPTPGSMNTQPLTQTINFSTLTDKLTIDLPFDISAIASSGLAINYSIVSGPATINGNTITLNGVGGTVVVRASQGGDNFYFPAASVDQSFDVLLQNQTISFTGLPDKMTTDIPFDISASASSGLTVNFNIVSGPATINGNTITLDGIGGTVVVRASQMGNGDYNPAANVDQSFDVLLQNQSINFTSLPDKMTTDVPFDISGSASSGLPVSFSIISGPATINGNTITLDGVGGTVLVRASQNGNDDYNAASNVDQSFDVLLQDQTIGFGVISDKFTTDIPFDVMATTSSGLSVSLSIVSGPASISGNTITLNGTGGTVLVRASQNGNDTYNPAQDIEQSFEVLLQSQTIDFATILDKQVTDGPFDISANASSGLPVTLSILSGPASLSGNTITLDGVVGTVLVEASQGGNSDYLPAQTLSQSFEVTVLDNQTIDFTAIADKLTIDDPFNISATASSGLPVTINLISGPASLSGNTITLDGIGGTVVLEASQGGNAEFNPAMTIEQSFEVLLQDQTIDFGIIADKLTIDLPFDIMASSTSGLPVSYNIVSGPASILGNTITLNGVGGTVVVEAIQLGNDDYNPAVSVEQSFEVLLQDQTIDFGTIADKLTVDLPFDITASSTSGLPVSYNIISGPASILGNTITLDGVGGTVVVEAIQLGNDDYNPAVSVEQSFEVLLQDQTIDFGIITDKLTVDLPFDIMASSTSGLSVSYNIISGPASISGNTITLDGVGGTVVVEAIQLGNDDYNPAVSVEQSFEVLLQDQTINFEMIADKFTNDSDFEIFATASSGLEVDFNIVSGPASVSGSMITLEGTEGTVVVEAIQIGDDDYNPAISIEQNFEVFLFISTKDLEDQTVFILYPNPVKDELHLQASSNAEGVYKISIHDIYGRLLREQMLDFGSNKVQETNVKDLMEGVYTITLFKDGGFSTLKFIKL